MCGEMPFVGGDSNCVVYKFNRHSGLRGVGIRTQVGMRCSPFSRVREKGDKHASTCVDAHALAGMAIKFVHRTV